MARVSARSIPGLVKNIRSFASQQGDNIVLWLARVRFRYSCGGQGQPKTSTAIWNAFVRTV